MTGASSRRLLRLILHFFYRPFDEAAETKIDPHIDDRIGFTSRQASHESVVLQERESLARRQMLEEERRRREEAEKRLQDETFHRQQLVEKEVKMRAKNFSQVGQTAPSSSPFQ